MSYADKLFIDMCSDIIENGYSTEGEKVRPNGRMELMRIQLKSLV